MNSETDARERRNAKLLMVLAPIGMMIICAFVVTGLAPGLDAGHPMVYLVATCVLWAMISLVLPILRLMELVSLPAGLVAVIYGNMFFYVLCLCAGFYLNVSWCGDFGHVVSSIVVSSIVFVAICLIDAHSPPHVTMGSRAGVTIMLFMVAMSFGGIWEMMEGFTDAVTGSSYMVYGATDTMGDLSADFLGVTAVSIFAYLYLGRSSTDRIASKVRFGKKAFARDEE